MRIANCPRQSVEDSETEDILSYHLGSASLGSPAPSQCSSTDSCRVRKPRVQHGGGNSLRVLKPKPWSSSVPQKFLKEFNAIMTDKMEVELNLMERRHALHNQQVKLQQGAEIAELQLRQDIQRLEADMLRENVQFRGKSTLLPDLSIAFGNTAVATYGAPQHAAQKPQRNTMWDPIEFFD